MSTSEQVAILDKAIELISPEGAWIQGAFARNHLNQQVTSFSSSAVCWCAYGVLIKCDADPHLVVEVTKSIDGADSLSIWNDHPNRTQQEVIDLLKRVRDKLA